MPGEVVHQLSPYADECFLIENKPIRGLDGSTCVGSIYSDLKLIIDGIGKGTGFCLDFGHAICAARTLKKEPIEFINELKNLILVFIILRMEIIHVSLTVICIMGLVHFL